MQKHSANYVVDLIHLGREYEELLQELYRTFAEKVPENRDFWSGIASAEARHVKLMDALEEYARQNMLRMQPESLLAIDDVQISINHLTLYISEVKSRGISARRAALIAKELEEGILEKEFDKQFVADTEDAMQMLQRLCEETRGHSAALDALVVRKDEFTRLVHENIATQVQVELARTIAGKEGLPVDTVLIERFNVPREMVRASFASHFRLEAFTDPYAFSVPEEFLRPLIDRYEDMKKRLYVPAEHDGDMLVMALGNPADLPLRDEIECLYPGVCISFQVGLSDDILSRVDHLFGGEAGGTQASVSELFAEIRKQNSSDTIMAEQHEVVTEEDSALVKLVNLIIEEAHQKRASDIHIEPQQDEDTSVRIRVDGVLYPLMGVPGRYSRAILGRIKIMAGLDISERRVPQSGKIQYRRWGRLDTELRVETYPSNNSKEDAVIRILASGKPLSLDEMELAQFNRERLVEAISQPYGLFLCVGPTGSGKTTTLHSSLGHINSPDRKILTVEDPVEISQPGLRQLQVNRKAGLTFASALRSFLRADPDVIMVGEMRDLETAQTALQASLTGHLVMSTLHTNSAPETINRLLDMGLDSFSFADALLAVIAQRLTRRLCSDCRQASGDSESDLPTLREEYGNDVEFDSLVPGASILMAQGCETCNHGGYRGRLAIHELLSVDDSLREMIMHKASVSALRTRAIEIGMRSLRQDGIGKTLKGLTTLSEVHRVCSR